MRNQPGEPSPNDAHCENRKAPKDKRERKEAARRGHKPRWGRSKLISALLELGLSLMSLVMAGGATCNRQRKLEAAADDLRAATAKVWALLKEKRLRDRAKRSSPPRAEE